MAFARGATACVRGGGGDCGGGGGRGRERVLRLGVQLPGLAHGHRQLPALRARGLPRPRAASPLRPSSAAPLADTRTDGTCSTSSVISQPTPLSPVSSLVIICSSSVSFRLRRVLSGLSPPLFEGRNGPEISRLCCESKINVPCIEE
jgi:hypothetical protein